MATYCVEMPDEDFIRVINAVASNYGRPDTIDGLENPETKAQFTNRIVRQFLSENVIVYEKRIAIQQIEQDLNTSITISDPQV
jgi:hypothetical protein